MVVLNVSASCSPSVNGLSSLHVDPKRSAALSAIHCLGDRPVWFAVANVATGKMVDARNNQRVPHGEALQLGNVMAL
jgi:ribosomal protein L2